jgi:tetratricopeptide (TPR) repeat protein
MSDDVFHTDQELKQLADRYRQCISDCQFRTGLQVAREWGRTAKNQHRVVDLMLALHYQAHIGLEVLDPQASRAAALELIVLLQDEEQARRVQPDLNESQYHEACYHLTTCAYDHLAEATGLSAGFNSPGMQACIQEGLQVCRQTGKLDCLKCFRLYAADVYNAADDQAMVRQQCQWLLERKEDDPEQDRRWTTLQKLAAVDLLEGRVQPAAEDLSQAMGLIQELNIPSKERAAALILANWNEVRALQGQPALAEKEVKALFPTLARGEWPRLDLEQDKGAALIAALAGEYDAAREVLTSWDRRLTEQHCLADWFEVRLRLIALYLLADQRPRAQALARGLEAQAQEAQDFLTLRRLTRLMSADAPVCPIPLLKDLESSADGTGALSRAADPLDMESPTDDVIQAPTPLSETLAAYLQEMMAAQDDPAARKQMLDTFLQYRPEQVSDAADAAYLVHLSRYVIQGPDDALLVWPWAEGMRQRFPDDATVLSVVASLGHYFRQADPEAFEPLIPLADLEKWFRLSLSLNPNHPRNFGRAGAFFLEAGEPGEAERCISRAFRLDRSDAAAAQQLAEIYRDTERPRDALGVLDLCLRAGTDDAHVAWEAGMIALQLEQYDALLTYLERFAALAEQHPAWLHYYRGLALFHLGRLEECLEELDRELEFRPPGSLHLHAIRLCVFEKQQRRAAARREAEQFLAIRLSDVDYLSLHGLVRLTELLCHALVDWPVDDSLRQRLARRLLRAGLMSDEFLEQLRRENLESSNLRFFRIQLRQPLDVGWPDSEGCLSGQQGWPDYHIDWGVLADSEPEAVERVLELQNVCEPAPAQIVKVESGEETFRDRPGVVWQGYRRCVSAEAKA